jgi:hypothetical protein
MVLIVTGADDVTADLVESQLRMLGKEYLRFGETRGRYPSSTRRATAPLEPAARTRDMTPRRGT